MDGGGDEEIGVNDGEGNGQGEGSDEDEEFGCRSDMDSITGVSWYRSRVEDLVEGMGMLIDR
jgi:hypothetical protein